MTNYSRGSVQEKVLKDARAITQTGTNAECYWSNDGKLFSYQAIPEGTTHPCDAIFTMDVNGKNVTPISGECLAYLLTRVIENATDLQTSVGFKRATCGIL